jgi:hypothetical protein
MPELWTDEEGRKHEVVDVNPFLPLAIITVLAAVLAILTIWMCLR